MKKKWDDSKLVGREETVQSKTLSLLLQKSHSRLALTIVFIKAIILDVPHTSDYIITSDITCTQGMLYELSGEKVKYCVEHDNI